LGDDTRFLVATRLIRTSLGMPPKSIGLADAQRVTIDGQARSLAVVPLFPRPLLDRQIIARWGGRIQFNKSPGQVDLTEAQAKPEGVEVSGKDQPHSR
jgi:hypothetical protein